MTTRYSSVFTESRPWVVVNTQPHKEQIALENLERQGFHAYCPMIRKRVKHARYCRELLRPLFPSYLFVHVQPDLQRWRPMLSTAGVRTLVRFGEHLSFLDDGFITALKLRGSDGAITVAPSRYQVGQQVRVDGGAFDGLVATIIDMDEKARMVLLMNILNRPVKVKVKARAIVAV
jgi:transcriptional antiterminator RfaH